MSDDFQSHKTTRPPGGHHQSHQHRHHRRRRSSSTSNFVNPRSLHARSSLRQLSNRSLNMTGEFKTYSDEIDYNEFYETASACDYDDDDQTCSTCSSTLTTTSTDSESDLDDFGFDPYYNMLRSKIQPVNKL